MKTRTPNLMVALVLLALSTVNLQLATAFGRGTAFSRLLKICAVALFINTAVSLNATVWTVTSLADSGPGTLRQTVTLSSPGDTIQFAVTGAILLSSSINIPYNLAVQGPGPAALTVDAGGVDRAFITSGNPVILSGMTIRNGLVVGTAGTDGGIGQDGTSGGNAMGGAILENGPVLVLLNCWVTGNTVIGGRGGNGGSISAFAGAAPGNGGAGGAAYGGAIYFPGAVLTNINCTFSQNRAIGGQGGDGGNCVDVAIAGGNGGGGGLPGGGALTGSYSFNLNCTFSGNSVSGGAGGNGGSSISSGGAGGPANVGNDGGAINNFSGLFISCTIVSNSAFAGAGGLGGSGTPSGANGAAGTAYAGGVWAYLYGGCLNLIGNTILADNYADTGSTNYSASWTDLGYNFIGSVDYIPGCPFGTTTQAGTIAVPIHPQLGPLAQNGGGLPTHATTLSSPVTDQGYSFGLTTDERGAPRPYSFGLPRSPGGDGSDIGAFELGSADLGAAMSSNGMVLSWPAYYGDFTLQSTSNLLAPGNWMNVTDTPVIIGSVFVVTNNPIGAISFYRLISH